jgi:hypothetical protein
LPNPGSCQSESRVWPRLGKRTLQAAKSSDPKENGAAVAAGGEREVLAGEAKEAQAGADSGSDTASNDDTPKKRVFGTKSNKMPPKGLTKNQRLEWRA